VVYNKSIIKELRMRKVVYNNCYGGFSISEECIRFLADRGNEECIALVDNRDWHRGASLYDSVLPRHDALLVIAVETLGSERASGRSANLAVHTLKGDRYYIDEYDGSEAVIEPDDINWIEV
tara:strand:- start:2966 stop:3331 length:366 start_codon:yes stop_codon:yes gene_type:complete